MAEALAVPINRAATPQELQAAQKQRAQAHARDAQVKALPALAAKAKADAIVAKAQTGGNTGGTLSGVPQGQMPFVPGNPPGQPGRPNAIPCRPGFSGQPA